MAKHGKIWGNTQEIAGGPAWSVHRIEIKAGGYCSEHYHAHKHNLFYVESGMLEVSTWQANDMEDSTVIMAGESTSVAPGKRHRFKALIDTVAYEVYWLEPLSEDIVRLTTGGIHAAE